jgi:hypothetical protein
MAQITRLADPIKQKANDFLITLGPKLSLLLDHGFDAFFLFWILKVDQEWRHAYEQLPFCSLKCAVAIIATSLLVVPVVKVLSRAAIETFKHAQSVKNVFFGSRANNPVDSKNCANPNYAITTRHGNVTITITGAGIGSSVMSCT